MPCYGLAEHVLFAAGKRDMSAPPVMLLVDSKALNDSKRLVPCEEDGKKKTQLLVSSGRKMRDDVVKDPGHLAIVDENTLAEVPNGHLGEIWLTGKSKALGYFQNHEATRDTFQAPLAAPLYDETKRFDRLYGHQWLRTGDVGCWHDGNLYVTGRIKEMIIINGHNLFPNDVEEAIKLAGASCAKDMIRLGSIAVSDDFVFFGWDSVS
jgi:fatty acid CoA ligase FadD32